MKYHTLKIELCNGEKILFRNMDEEAIKKAKERIWKQGIVKQIDKYTKELINPFIIKAAYIIEQENFEG